MLDGEFHFLIDEYSDRRRCWQRRGQSLLFSVLVHLLLILSILFGPLLLAPSRKLSPEFMERELTRLDTSRPSFLPLPEDRQKPKKPLEAPVLSDQDRIAQGKAPMIDSRGEKAPFQEGDTKLVEQAARQGESPVLIPPPPSQPAGNQHLPQDGLAKDQPGSESKMPLPGSAPAGSSRTGQSLRDLMAQMETPGSAVRQSLEAALNKGMFGSGGKGSGGGTSMHQFDNRRADFSVEEPTILTDTQGADFGPWLRIVYFRVRDNWYSAIPELIRSGARGKAVLVFDVKKDGRVYNLQLAKTSGLHPYDRAAISSIKLAEPFPNFPPSFAGDQITIQFSYFYNIRI